MHKSCDKVVECRANQAIGYNKKETKLKKCVQPNKVIILYYLHRDQNEKYFPDL